MKTIKGITLIALVITIIILIILAGISISLLTGEDGIITKAKQGALNYQNAAVEEQVMLNNLYGDFASEIAKTGSGDAVASLISFKRTIAEAITNAGVETSENDSAETMAENIGQAISAAQSSNTGCNIYCLGTGTSIDLTTLLPDIDYTTLTVDNFIIGDPESIRLSASTADGCDPAGSVSGTKNFVKSYNSSTGIFTYIVSYSVQSNSGRYARNSACTLNNCKVYLILGDIEDVTI